MILLQVSRNILKISVDTHLSRKVSKDPTGGLEWNPYFKRTTVCYTERRFKQNSKGIRFHSVSGNFNGNCLDYSHLTRDY